MSVTELRQRLEDYWGQGGILGAIIDEERDLYRIVRDGSRLNPAVLSHWVNRECNQWLSYFIAKHHNTWCCPCLVYSIHRRRKGVPRLPKGSFYKYSPVSRFGECGIYGISLSYKDSHVI